VLQKPHISKLSFSSSLESKVDSFVTSSQEVKYDTILSRACSALAALSITKRISRRRYSTSCLRSRTSWVAVGRIMFSTMIVFYFTNLGASLLSAFRLVVQTRSESMLPPFFFSYWRCLSRSEVFLF